MVSVFDVAPETGFQTEIGLLLETLDAGTLDWREDLGEMDDELLKRRPFLNGPSIGALLHHVACSEAWWIETIVGERRMTETFDPCLVEGEADPNAGQWSEAPRMASSKLLLKMDEVRGRTREILRGETQPDGVVPVPTHLQVMTPNYSGFNIRWIVAHVAQHEAYHGGQAVMKGRMLTEGVW